MACLKCGRETDQTFCDICRADMEKHPVKPGAILLIPKERQSTGRRSQNWHPQLPIEAELEHQRKLVNWLAIIVIVLVVFIFIMGFFIFQLTRSRDERPLGQNYSTVVKTTPEAETEAELTTVPD